MEYVSTLLFWISNGLLIPVIVGLLFFFCKALYMLGAFFNRYLQRNRQNQALQASLHQLDAHNVLGLATVLDALQTSFARAARQLYHAKDSEVHRKRYLSEFEIEADKELGKAKILVKFGPILGLMGTLIPMGPALVGLSTGDIGSMAYNMQVAFATTVLGLFTGAAGFLLIQIQQRWVMTDLTTLDFISDLLTLHQTDTTCNEDEY
jgi:biopolymer transport protein ExbB/TolQ